MAWILVVVRAGVILSVLAVGLTAGARDVTFLLRRPRKLAMAMISMNVVMPLFVAATLALVHVRPAVALALMTLAVSPIPPILPKRAMSAGGAAPYTIGLLVAAALFAIVIVPFAVVVESHVPALAIVRVIALTVLAPLAMGMLVRRLAPRFAERAVRPASIAGLALVFAGFLPMVVVAVPDMARLIGNGTLAALVAFNVVGLVAGHVLGGPVREERTVLALTTSSRHPGVALAVSTGLVADPKPVFAALLMYLVVNLLASTAYAAWAKRSHT